MTHAAPHRLRFALFALSIGSGCSALVYEVVWFQILQLVIGSSALSLAVLLATFMGGMCIGSLVLPRLRLARRHPLRLYATLEFGIAVAGLLVLVATPYLGGAYAATLGHGVPGLLLRSLVSAVCLLPPTLLMGATLPAIAPCMGTTREGVSWLGILYAGNIAGSVFGCVLAGFYLLRVYDTAIATCVAAIINASVAMTALSLAAGYPYARPDRSPLELSSNPHVFWPVYATIAVSGATALGAEVVWTRLLSLMLGATVYSFSIILAVFLVGLGLGSHGGSRLARTFTRPRIALGCCQLALVVATAWAAYALAALLPYWRVDSTVSARPWALFQFDLVRSVFAVLPATLFWGASFPLALAASAPSGADAGRVVARVYAANTAGAIVGSIGFSLLAIPLVGTQGAERLLIIGSLAAALLMFAPHRAAAWTAIAASLAGGMLLTWTVPNIPAVLVAYGRTSTTSGTPDILYVGEGMNSSVAVTELSNGVRNFHVSGKVEASTEPQDMHLQRMLGHIPALLHEGPRSVLVVGFGAGVTAGSFVPYPEVDRLVICEIEPLVLREIARYFEAQNYAVLADPRVHVVEDDARHYVLTTPERFDIITSDPIHPWVKGAATLYTREYFELVKQHLNPGGLVAQWVPLYESNIQVVKSELATFFDVFPDGTIWANNNNGQGYDLVLAGRAAPLPIDIDAVQRRLDRPDYRDVAASLEEIGVRSAIDLLATYTGQGRHLLPWLHDAIINRDRNLRLQYLAGMGLNQHESDVIYRDILAYRTFPGGIFTPSAARMGELWNAMNLVNTTRVEPE